MRSYRSYRHFDSSAGENQAKTGPCAAQLSGIPAVCTLEVEPETQATCSSGTLEFCAADGVTLYGGCEAGFGAATRRITCYGSSPVCITQTQGHATCGY